MKSELFIKDLYKNEEEVPSVRYDCQECLEYALSLGFLSKNATDMIREYYIEGMLAWEVGAKRNLSQHEVWSRLRKSLTSIRIVCPDLFKVGINAYKKWREEKGSINMQTDKFMFDYCLYNKQERVSNDKVDVEGCFRYVLGNSQTLLEEEKEVLKEIYDFGVDTGVLGSRYGLLDSQVHRIRVRAMKRIKEEFDNLFEVGLEEYIKNIELI